MTDQLKNVLILVIVVFVLFLLWAGSIGITYWDTVSRRKLTGLETAAWVGLVVLVPGIGFGAYLFSRLLGAALPTNRPAASRPRRVTMIKGRIDPGPRTGTIAAAQFLQPDTAPPSSISSTLTGLVSSAPGYTLSIISGPNSGEEYLLESFPIKIGRGPDVSIRLDEDRGVSRQHAEIYEQTGLLRIRDLNSTHGTRVNETNVSDASLGPGDQIRVGVSILKVGVREEPG